MKSCLCRDSCCHSEFTDTFVVEEKVDWKRVDVLQPCWNSLKMPSFARTHTWVTEFVTSQCRSWSRHHDWILNQVWSHMNTVPKYPLNISFCLHHIWKMWRKAKWCWQASLKLNAWCHTSCYAVCIEDDTFYVTILNWYLPVDWCLNSFLLTYCPHSGWCHNRLCAQVYCEVLGKPFSGSTRLVLPWKYSYNK